MQEKSVSVKDFYEKLDVNNLRYSYYKNCLELRNRVEYIEGSGRKPQELHDPCLLMMEFMSQSFFLERTSMRH